MRYCQQHSDKEVSDAAFYRTHANTPDRNGAVAIRSGRWTRLRRSVAGGADRDGIAGGGGHVARLRVAPTADAVGLSWAGHQPGRLVPGGGRPGAGLAGVPGRAAVYAADRPVLQGADPIAGGAVGAADAGNGSCVTSGGVGGLALAGTARQSS